MIASSSKPPSDDRLAEVDRFGGEYNTECVEIQGIVSLSCQGGWRAVDDYEVHSFSFSAWRRVGGPLVNRRLLVLRPVASDDGKKYSGFPACSIHRIRVLLSKDETRAVFANASKMAGDDKELLAIGEELQKPVVVSTARFGELFLDGTVEWFEGEADWNRESVRINFHSDNLDTLDNLLRTAEALWDDQVEWKRKVEDFAVKELLPLKNEYWLSEGEKALTPDEFKARMSLQSVSIFSDGEFEFWHDDGDLFWGHSIQISGSLKDGPTRADIPG